MHYILTAWWFIRRLLARLWYDKAGFREWELRVKTDQEWSDIHMRAHLRGIHPDNGPKEGP